jgi:hypothetical protein
MAVEIAVKPLQWCIIHGKRFKKAFEAIAVVIAGCTQVS